MSKGKNGKGSRDRTTNKKKYDSCPLWNNMKAKKKEAKK